MGLNPLRRARSWPTRPAAFTPARSGRGPRGPTPPSGLEAEPDSALYRRVLEGAPGRVDEVVVVRALHAELWRHLVEQSAPDVAAELRRTWTEHVSADATVKEGPELVRRRGQVKLRVARK